MQQLRTEDGIAEKHLKSLKQAADEGTAPSGQIEQAQINRHQIAQAYNDFLDTDRHYHRQGNDAARALERPHLSPLERHQLETTRDQAWATAGEFQLFKSSQQLRPIHLAPVHTDTLVHTQGQATQLNTLAPQGQALQWLQRAGDALDSAYDFVVNRFIGTPSREQNEKACAMALNGVAGIVSGRLVPNMGGPAGDRLGNGAWSTAIDAANPGATTCRRLYSDAGATSHPAQVHAHAHAQGYAPPAHFTPEVHAQWALAQRQLAPALRGQGHTQPQIDRVCAAAVCHAQRHARLGPAEDYLLSTDGQRVGVVYGSAGVRDFDVQEAQRHSVEQQLQQAQVAAHDRDREQARETEHPAHTRGALVMG
ncbi:MAG: hypothetical protein C0453_06350 [Comamonadaceae bacterium]|nr:hypothetical protein [Comamonadaceae bacterium]